MTANQVGKIIQDGTTKYQLVDVIGHGTYGSIYLGRGCNPPHALYAVKCLPRHPVGSRQANIQQQEIAIHSSLGQHPNIISLEFVVETKECVYIGMEYCEGGDLYEAITSCKGPGFGGTSVQRNALVKQAFLQVLHAVEYCHSKGVYHRDIKPENILISNNGLFKLADFGLATTDRISNEFGCGSSFYMSPESQVASRTGFAASNQCSYSPPASDVWALGIILINLCFGRNPWKQATLADPTFAAFFRDQTILLEMFPLTREAANVLYQTLEINPKRRCTLNKLLAMVQSVERFIEDEPSHSPEESVCINIDPIDYLTAGNIENTNLPKSTENPREGSANQQPYIDPSHLIAKSLLNNPSKSTLLSSVKGKHSPNSEFSYSNCSTPSRCDSYTSWSSIATDSEYPSPTILVERHGEDDSLFKRLATEGFHILGKSKDSEPVARRADREIVEYNHSPSPSPRYSPWFHLRKSEYVRLTPKERQPACRQKIRVQNLSDDEAAEEDCLTNEFEDRYDSADSMFGFVPSDRTSRSGCCFCLG
ncbi:Pkinase-domain-containing protein [Basidiobolus meristosporus CBS 931.73]|uniref:Pkinase-domain-containing protein n=1 Tax=Basidiobolus meristosporus CBS 931.73 TaxID=1314790 RepID=A0A1Y1Y6V0_9FUNG|nr:Pkinase-domain-containing protein [Basidiobolus meristosporus CBS 931.73]|eukprot:ORX93732.1 Pkinase-domain-containing protein [Basidiobolus meristosporus CBS 931.73]